MSQPDPMHDQMVAAERSLFGTRLPRPTGVGRHLFVVLVVSALALGLAIYFAESGGSPVTTTPTTTQPAR
ncbi:MAG: hypothetical protein FJ137_19305 [Deltaproteobacteria bacterium]|nr:hypothetical protein [Deltaproteobacteria bacterium]